MPDSATDTGIVVIGRNEGVRLRRCLESLGAQVKTAVYVDSGSQDDSVAFAKQIGATVVELDPSIPFTAARARNEGFRALEQGMPDLAMVQFVDGDCEIEPRWLQRAAGELREHADLAVVFGRRRERHRDASVYNRLCDLEWDVPIGDVLSCGGDALMRASAFRQCGGYDRQRIAGEEPELCVRLRDLGWRIRRIDAPMTVHDADIHRFVHWWRRAVRSGYVEAEGLAELGGRYPRRRAAWSNLGWAVALPLVGACVIAYLLEVGHRMGAVVAAAAGAGACALLWLRIFLHAGRRWRRHDAALYATFCLFAKWPAVQGMATYWWRRMRGKNRRLIEYKGAGPR